LSEIPLNSTSDLIKDSEFGKNIHELKFDERNEKTNATSFLKIHFQKISDAEFVPSFVKLGA
jgi:hypothetical protein